MKKFNRLLVSLVLGLAIFSLTPSVSYAAFPCTNTSFPYLCPGSGGGQCCDSASKCSLSGNFGVCQTTSVSTGYGDRTQCKVNISASSLSYINASGQTIDINSDDIVINTAVIGNQGKMRASITASNENCSSYVNYKAYVQKWNGGAYETLYIYEEGSGVFNIGINNLTAGGYRIKLLVRGEGKNGSWWEEWQSKKFYYSVVTEPLKISNDAVLNGKITIPYYNGVINPLTGVPDYYLLIGTDPGIVNNTTENPPGETKVPQNNIWWMDYQGSPNWTLTINIRDYEVPGLGSGTYYWRLRQRGSTNTVYIPGGEVDTTRRLMNVSPTVQQVPLNATVTLNATSTISQPVQYYIWWNCHPLYSSLADTVAQTITACGDPANDLTGKIISGASNAFLTTTHTYIYPGGYTPKIIAKFNNGIFQAARKTILVTNAAFGKFNIIDHTTVEFNHKLWSIGNYSITNSINDPSSRVVYSSDDGITWQPAGDLGNFLGKWQHSSLVFNSKIWAFGGYNGGSIVSSLDGMNWRYEQSINNALGLDDPMGFPVTLPNSTTLEFLSKMWIIGGNGSNKVYFTLNGVNWTEVANLPLPASIPGSGLLCGWHSSHTSVVYDSKMWVIGGACNVDNAIPHVYSSSDGISWALVGQLPRPTAEHASVVFNGKMWVIGGQKKQAASSTGDYYSEVYSSADGVTWNLEGKLPIVKDQNWNSGMPYPATRSHHSAVIFNNKIWIIGGIGPGDGVVFSSEDGKTWQQEFPIAPPTVVASASPVPLSSGTGFGSTSSCIFTSTNWVLPTGVSNPIPAGTQVSLQAEGNSECIGKTVEFKVREDDWPFGSDPVRINPVAVVVTGDVITATWISEYQQDGIRGFADPPEYYFEANVIGQTNKIRSAANLQVQRPAQSGGVPSATPTSAPTVPPEPTSMPTVPPVPTTPPSGLTGCTLTDLLAIFGSRQGDANFIEACDFDRSGRIGAGDYSYLGKGKAISCGTAVGDINADLLFTNNDLEMIKKHLAGNQTFTDNQKYRADATVDGQVTIDDLKMFESYMMTGTPVTACQDLIINDISVKNNTQDPNNKVDIVWKTSYPGTSEILFGLSKDNLQSLTASPNPLVTNHIVTLTPEKGKIYYYKVRSLNAVQKPFESGISIFRTKL